MIRIPTRATAALVASVVVVLARPDRQAWSVAWAGIRGARPSPSLDTLVGLVAGVGLWTLAAWVLLALAAGRLAGAPGFVGALGRAVVRVAVPRVLRGIVTGGLAGGVVGGLLLSPTAGASPVWQAGAPVPTVASVPGPAWPTSPAPPATATPETSTPATSPPATSTPATSTPATSSPAAPSTPAASAPTAGDVLPPTASAIPGAPAPTVGPGTPVWPTSPDSPDDPDSPNDPDSPSGPGGPALPTTPTTPAVPGVGGADVVVAPGDSLWSIAAADLRRRGAAATDSAVAAAWPAWFAVNRAAVGADPGLLRPGTPLTAPAVTPTPTDGSTP